MRGNLADLAATGLASGPTLRKWIAAEPDQPWILKRGKNGDAYEIDIPAAVASFRAREEEAASVARDRAAQLRQLGLDLGLATSADETVELSIAERKQLLEEELVAIKLSRMRGELVPYAAAQEALADVLVTFRQRRQTFTARLAKRADFTRAQLTAIERLTEADDEDLANLLEKAEERLGERSAEDGEDSAAALDHPAVSDAG